jgi:hypothetical protein
VRFPGPFCFSLWRMRRASPGGSLGSFLHHRVGVGKAVDRATEAQARARSLVEETERRRGRSTIGSPLRTVGVGDSSFGHRSSLNGLTACPPGIDRTSPTASGRFARSAMKCGSLRRMGRWRGHWWFGRSSRVSRQPRLTASGPRSTSHGGAPSRPVAARACRSCVHAGLCVAQGHPLAG